MLSNQRHIVLYSYNNHFFLFLLDWLDDAIDSPMIVNYNISGCSSMNWLLSLVLIFWAVSVVMFSTFEHSVDFLYRKVVKRRKEDCSITQQLGVTCLAGYTAGSVGSLISNPADNVVASLYNRKADSLMLVIISLHLAFIILVWKILEVL